MAAATTPAGSAFLQFLSDAETQRLCERIDSLEDPVGSLHPRIKHVALALYRQIREANSSCLPVSPEFYGEFAQPLEALSANQYIDLQKGLGNRPPSALRLSNPLFVLYMTSLAEEPTTMDQLCCLVDTAKASTTLDAGSIREDIPLPLPVFDSVFAVFESAGRGTVSRTIGVHKYIATV